MSGKHKMTFVGTVFIAFAVEMHHAWRAVSTGIDPHGGRDEYGPYGGSLYLNGIAINTVPTVVLPLSDSISFSAPPAHPEYVAHALLPLDATRCLRWRMGQR